MYEPKDADIGFTHGRSGSPSHHTLIYTLRNNILSDPAWKGAGVRFLQTLAADSMQLQGGVLGDEKMLEYSPWAAPYYEQNYAQFCSQPDLPEMEMEMG